VAGAEDTHLRGAVLPGAVNAHSHAFQILLRGKADGARDFRDWVDHYMYPLALALDEDGLAAASRLAFAEMLLNGVTTVGEFFYLHNAPERDGCAARGNRNAETVIEAARSVGIRIHLLRCLYDRAVRPGQRRFHEPAAEAVAATGELAAAHAGTARVSVGIAPHSLHGATAEGIVAAAEYARRQDQPFQIHIAEEEHDLAFAQEHYGTTPGRVLDDLGVLSGSTCVVHGVWLDGEEIARLGAVGGKLAYNPISNMALGDGVTDIPAMVAAGVTVALGCDGPGANHQVNVWQEMRFVEWLQRVTQRRMNVVSHVPAAATANYCFEMGTRNGGAVLGLPVGELRPGWQADFVVLDTDDPSLLPHHGPEPAALLHNVVNAMDARAAVRDVWVGGEPVVRERRLVHADTHELARAVAGWHC
jgi:5-methylthioadenosine/S-adenosylhomocysteine deaminase